MFESIALLEKRGEETAGAEEFFIGNLLSRISLICETIAMIVYS